MAITQGQNANASDFINESEQDGTRANDAGRVPKLESDGYLANSFLKDIGNRVGINVTELTNGTGTSEQTLFQTSIPANTLGTTGAIRFTAYLSTVTLPAGTFTLTVRMKYGSTTMATLTFTVDNNAGSMKGVITGYLVADGSTSAQKGAVEMRVMGNGTVEEVADAAVGIDKLIGFADGAATEVSTGALNLTLTTQFDSGGATNVTGEFFIVEKIQTRLTY